MNFGKILSFISPAAGAITGQGIGKALPFLSPAYGMATGKGIGQLLGGMLGGSGGDGEEPAAISPDLPGGADISQLLELLRGGNYDPRANYLNMFGG